MHFSIACLQEELGQLNLSTTDLPFKDDSQQLSYSNLQPTGTNLDQGIYQTKWPAGHGSIGVMGGGVGGIHFSGSFPEKQFSWFHLLNCIKPVFSFINNVNGTEHKSTKNEDWEIPFEAIKDLEWIGSGAQGAVFSGKLLNEMVAVKKVRDDKETDVKHLRKLNHENIIKFK